MKPANNINKNVVWTSSIPAVAYVNKFGEVASLSIGTAKIYAISNQNGAWQDSCLVTLFEKHIVEISQPNIVIKTNPYCFCFNP